MQQYKIKHLYLSVIIYLLLFITESIAGEAIVEDRIEVPDSVAKIHKILLKNRPHIIQSNGVKILRHKKDKIYVQKIKKILIFSLKWNFTLKEHTEIKKNGTVTYSLELLNTQCPIEKQLTKITISPNKNGSKISVYLKTYVNSRFATNKRVKEDNLQSIKEVINKIKLLLKNDKIISSQKHSSIQKPQLSFALQPLTQIL
jgi:hypothetical protein